MMYNDVRDSLNRGPQAVHNHGKVNFNSSIIGDAFSNCTKVNFTIPFFICPSPVKNFGILL
jgi:hypothetical protein